MFFSTPIEKRVQNYTCDSFEEAHVDKPKLTMGEKLSKRFDLHRKISQLLISSELPLSKYQVSVLNFLGHTVSQTIFAERKLGTYIDSPIYFSNDNYDQTNSHLKVYWKVPKLIKELKICMMTKEEKLHSNPDDSFLYNPPRYIISHLLLTFLGADDDNIETSYFTTKKTLNLKVVETLSESKLLLSLSENLNINAQSAAEKTNRDLEEKKPKE